MYVSQIYSHLNAEEYLRVRQPTLYQEILGLLGKCQTKRLTIAQASFPIKSLKHIGSSFKKLAQQSGWSKARVGLRKGRVTMRFYYAPYPTISSFDEILGSRLIDYVNGKIDVAIEIFPTEIDRAAKSDKLRNPNIVRGFEEAKEMIGRLGRHCPPVPLLIIGITP